MAKHDVPFIPLRASQRFGGQGKWHLFQGNRERRPHFEGNRAKNTLMENREHNKTSFSIFGEQGNKSFLGEQGNRYPLRVPYRGSNFIPSTSLFVCQSICQHSMSNCVSEA